MQTLAILSKSTKQGVSVWRFVQTDDNQFFAFGGCKPACKQFENISQLRSYYRALYTKYGYEAGLVPLQPAKKTAFLSDPWSSELPVHLQYELEALSA